MTVILPINFDENHSVVVAVMMKSREVRLPQA